MWGVELTEFKLLSGGGRMHLIIVLIALVALAAIIIYVVDWISVDDPRAATAIDILDRRLASGEIDRAEYEQKRKLLAR
jgi:uncharacterized membrane protein